MSDLRPVIGLEVHAQLLTQTKIFCGCSTRFGLAPNTNTCPVCLGLPGVLPVLNRQAVEFGLRLGLAIHSRINALSAFARKNYFYPDLPKGYQITQYEHPLCQGGYVEIDAAGEKRCIDLERIHLEEDAGKSVHDPQGGTSAIDFNRAGIPLLEIVSRPEIEDPDQAVTFLKELRLLLVYLGICDGNMEEGSLRCDANVSLARPGQEGPGTRTELKNMNSFSHIRKALAYEIQRQRGVLEAGQAVISETRLWDEARGVTAALRGKEEGRDYRYFPEPDLPELLIETAWIEAASRALPELPREKRRRFQDDYGLSPAQAGLLTQTPAIGAYYETCVALFDRPREIGRWVANHVLRVLKEQTGGIEDLRVSPEMLVDLLRRMEAGEVSSRGAREVFDEMALSARGAEEIIRERGLTQIRDEGQIRDVVRAIIEEHPREVAAYRSGKTPVLQFLVGQVMHASRGAADPGMTQIIMKEMLDS